jgi:hypothetical protein
MNVRGYSRGWLVAACIVSLALVLGAPFIGQLRGAIRHAAGDRFVSLMAGVVGGAAAAAVVYALARIRRRRAARYAALAAAVSIGVVYAWAARTGNPEVDAVERFHFIEYGLITILFYRGWRPSADGSVIILPLLAGFLVGTLEEWFQWFIPVRVGEVRDVLLNFVAIGCGLLFSLGLDPPERPTLALEPPSRRHVAVLSAIAVVVFGGFMHFVHLGYEIRDAEAGVFRSRYTAEELAALSADRAIAWKANPPLTWSRLSREDQYFSEGLTHVDERNGMWEHNVLAARHENLILEKYYAPVLDAPSYVSATGHRWAAEQRASAESRIGPGFMIYVSEANVYPIFTWPKWSFWLAIMAGVAVCLRGLRSPA